MNCYCCSELAFAACCQPYIQGIALPPTAEALMRSRYSAYATVAVGYIMQTTHYSTRHHHDPISIQQWAKASNWQKLEILSKKEGGIGDRQGIVQFKAFYLDAKHKQQVHHEYSTFVKEEGKWYFVDGKIA